MTRGWDVKHHTDGQYTPITDLLANGSHTVEAWGNSREGWFPYLVDKSGIGCPIGPHFGRDQGDRLKDLKEAASRAYGIDASAVKRGRNFP